MANQGFHLLDALGANQIADYALVVDGGYVNIVWVDLVGDETPSNPDRVQDRLVEGLLRFLPCLQLVYEAIPDCLPGG